MAFYTLSFIHEEEGDVRLVGGSTALSGRIEIYYDGQWGSICDDDWGHYDKGAGAQVVCRQLNLPYHQAQPIKESFFGGGSGPIWLDKVVCEGSESKLSECEHGGWGEHNCDHSEDAGVNCTGVEPLTESISPKFNTDAVIGGAVGGFVILLVFVVIVALIKSRKGICTSNKKVNTVDTQGTDESVTHDLSPNLVIAPPFQFNDDFTAMKDDEPSAMQTENELPFYINLQQTYFSPERASLDKKRQSHCQDITKLFLNEEYPAIDRKEEEEDIEDDYTNGQVTTTTATPIVWQIKPSFVN